MGTFVLILLLLAATFGVLGAVLKIALVLVLSAVLAIVLLAWIGAWYVRSRIRNVERELYRRAEQERRWREAYDVSVARDEPAGPTGELGDGSP